jgi:type IV fimbrial biogenesis protein FimT
MERLRGLTLTELVVAVAILAGLATWAVPAFRDLRRDASRTQQVSAFLRAVHLARAEAFRRNLVVSLCASSDGQTCAASGTPWHRGWIAFVNRDHDSPAERDPGEELLLVQPQWTDGTIAANRGFLSFRALRQSGVTATIAFCDARGSRAARAVIISQTGRPRVSDRGATGSPLNCP